jgi:hypothetical protein
MDGELKGPGTWQAAEHTASGTFLSTRGTISTGIHGLVEFLLITVTPGGAAGGKTEQHNSPTDQSQSCTDVAFRASLHELKDCPTYPEISQIIQKENSTMIAELILAGQKIRSPAC